MAALSPSEERFATIFSLCPVGLALTAEDGLVIEANPALGRLLDLEPADIVGSRLLDFTHPDDRGVSAAAGESVLEGKRDKATMEKRYVRHDGVEVPVRVTMIALDQPDGGAHKLTQIEDLSQQRVTEENLRREAHEDPLTGLANRRALQREIDPLLQGDASAPVGETPGPSREAFPPAEDPAWAVVMVDLDNFKAINDAHGHGIGDAVLKAVAGRLAGATRQADLVARVGGDEFVVLLGTGSRAEVTAAEARIRRALARPLRIAGRVVSVSASVGTALPRRDDSTEEILDRADAAMYVDKARHSPP
jgi:diguanylate cyclase (GGDEF)-like protein/PAS domain S-box-containing protein